MADALTLLAELGFGEYEARAYLALLGRNPVNGYELAKLSGVPRGNIYAVLGKLEDRGAVLRKDTPDGTRYAPVPPEELVQRLAGRYQKTLDEAGAALQAVGGPAESDAVWNIDGYPALLEHARSLLAEAHDELLLAVWPQESSALAADVAGAEGRGVAVHTLCLAGCAQECGNCRGDIYRYRMAEGDGARSLVVIPDGAEVLAGEIGSGGGLGSGGAAPAHAAGVLGGAGVRTRQRLLVDLAGAYVRQAIGLATVLSDLGARVGELLAPATLRALGLLTREDGDVSWLAHLRRALRAEK